MRVTSLHVLKDVRQILADPTNWTTGAYARDCTGREVDPSDRRAVRWCGQGAIYACGRARGMPSLRQIIRREASADADWARQLMEHLHSIAKENGCTGFIDANDRMGREMVLRVVDTAIAELETLTPWASRRRAARLSRRATSAVGHASAEHPANGEGQRVRERGMATAQADGPRAERAR
jgi:hypothetical protein